MHLVSRVRAQLGSSLPGRAAVSALRCRSRAYRRARPRAAPSTGDSAAWRVTPGLRHCARPRPPLVSRHPAVRRSASGWAARQSQPVLQASPGLWPFKLGQPPGWPGPAEPGTDGPRAEPIARFPQPATGLGTCSLCAGRGTDGHGPSTSRRAATRTSRNPRGTPPPAGPGPTTRTSLLNGHSLVKVKRHRPGLRSVARPKPVPLITPCPCIPAESNMSKSHAFD